MKKIYLILFFVLVSVKNFAQAPINDDIQNAVDITSLPFTDFNVATPYAAYTTINANGCLNSATLGKVFYRFKPTIDTSVNINLTYGYEYSFIVIYTSSVEYATSESQLTYNNDGSCGYNSTFTANLVANQVYYFMIFNDISVTDIQFSDANSSDIVNIPDANFKTALLNYTNPVIDTNGDGEIQVNEAILVQQINVTNKNISDLTGIEAFINLTSLTCRNNNLNNINVSSNTALAYLSCSSNNISSLDVTNNTNLLKLYCGYNNLSFIDLSQNLELNTFEAFYNINLGDVDLSNNLNLTTLNLGSCGVTNNLNLINNLNLRFLNLSWNNIDNIDLSQNTQLENLTLSSTNYDNFNASTFVNLEELRLMSTDLTTLNITSNSLLETLNISYSPISNIDISANINLLDIDARYCDLNSIDFSQNISLEKINIQGNNLSNLDFNNNTNLILLNAYNNPINNINLTQNNSLQYLSIYNTLIQTLDLSNNVSLVAVNVRSNPFLQYVNFKNLNNINIDGSYVSISFPNLNSGIGLSSTFAADNNPNLQTICVDDVGYATANFVKDLQTIFVDDCNATSVDYNIIQGTLTYDDDNNGCDSADINVPNQLINVTDGTNNLSTFTNASGTFAIDVPEGTYTTSIMNMPSYVNVTPNQVTDSFTSLDNTEIADFCLTANQNSINDINVVIIPINEARPGFDSEYQIVFENLGVLPVSGDVTFTFQDAFQSYISSSLSPSSQTSNSLTFNYNNLQPFEIRTIDLLMNTMPPPTVNADDILNFTATITPITTDQFQDDNTFDLDQVVVNSYDPNDKTVLQGSEIYYSEISNYLHYVIRFQNVGTADAINVLVTDQLSGDLDWQTLKPVSSSHDYTIKIINGDFIEFRFDNINLPAQQFDDAGSNGFVAFKIKPKSDAVVGDTFYNRASIYFDYNAPIITNTVSTEVVEALSTNEFTTEKSLVVYPNPSTGIFNIKLKEEIALNAISVFDLAGNEILNIDKPSTILDLNNLATGIYFLKIQTNKGEVNKRIIKK